MIEVPKTAVEAVRKRPDMYFQDGAPTMEELISAVMRDVVGIRNIAAKVVRCGTFAGVSADIDWLRTESAVVDELFARFVLPTPMRVNSHRAEVLLAAVCGDVLTEGEAGNFSIGLTWADVPDVITLPKGPARILVWRFDGFNRHPDSK